MSENNKIKAAEPVSEPLLRHRTGPFKVDQYLEELEGLDITESQKLEFLQTLCLIMKTFVDIGWGLDSIQRIFPPLSGDAPQRDSLALEQSRTARFNGAAEAKTEIIKNTNNKTIGKDSKDA